MTITQRLYAIGCMLFLWYACLVIVPQMFLLLGCQLTFWQFWVCFPLFVGSSWMFHRNYFGISKRHDFLLNLGLASVLFASCLYVSSAVYSTHVNSNGFHLEVIYAILDGWNPMHGMQINGMNDELKVFLSQYPMASWSYAALLASFTGSVEMGKAGGFHLLLCSLLIGQHLGRAVFKFSALVSWLLAILVALNPIQILDLFSFSTDGLASNLLFLGIAFSLYQIKEGGWLKGFFALIAFALLVNMKWSAAVPGIIALSSFLGFLLSSGAYKWQKIALIWVSWFLFSFLILGWNSYATCLTKNSITKDVSEPMAKLVSPEYINNIPLSFLELNRFEKFLLSVYAMPQSVNGGLQVEWKELFSKIDIDAYKNGNTNLAGLGPFAPEVLCLLFPLGLFVLFKKGNIYKKWGTIVLLVLMFSLFIVPNGWILRLSPQIWLLVLFLLILLFKESQWSGPAFVLCFGLLLNSVLLFHTYFVHSLETSEIMKKQYQEIASQPSLFELDAGDGTVFIKRAVIWGIDTSKFIDLGSDSLSVPFIGEHSAQYRRRMVNN
jgi:hypothetical protein